MQIGLRGSEYDSQKNKSVFGARFQEFAFFSKERTMMPLN